MPRERRFPRACFPKGPVTPNGQPEPQELQVPDPEAGLRHARGSFWGQRGIPYLEPVLQAHDPDLAAFSALILKTLPSRPAAFHSRLVATLRAPGWRPRTHRHSRGQIPLSNPRKRIRLRLPGAPLHIGRWRRRPGFFEEAGIGETRLRAPHRFTHGAQHSGEFLSRVFAMRARSTGSARGSRKSRLGPWGLDGAMQPAAVSRTFPFFKLRAACSPSSSTALKSSFLHALTD